MASSDRAPCAQTSPTHELTALLHCKPRLQQLQQLQRRLLHVNAPVHGDGSGRLLARGQEALQDGLRRVAAVQVIHVVVVDARRHEAPLVVVALVEADDGGDAAGAEVGDHVVHGSGVVALWRGCADVVRAGEGQKAALQAIAISQADGTNEGEQR